MERMRLVKVDRGHTRAHRLDEDQTLNFSSTGQERIFELN